MRLVKATADELPLLAPLFDLYRQFYHQRPNPEGGLSFLRDRISRNESVLFLALDNQNNGLGFTQLYPSFSSVSMKRLWILNDLFVAEDARHQGVAEALIRRCEAYGRETNSKGLVLETATDNIPAQTLYRKLGWNKEEEFDRYYINF